MDLQGGSSGEIVVFFFQILAVCSFPAVTIETGPTKKGLQRAYTTISKKVRVRFPHRPVDSLNHHHLLIEDKEGI